MQTKVLPFSLKAFSWFLSNLGRPFPTLSARLFLRLYGTPPKRKINAAQLETRSKAVISTVTLSKYAFDPSPVHLVSYRWGTPGKKILLLHGWSDTALSFGPMISRLVEEGYEVISYDAPAHGFSEGKRTNLVQWMHLLDQFIRQEGQLYAIIGHSIGALNAALTLTRKDDKVPRLVLVSPALSAPGFFKDTFELFKIRGEVLDKTYELIRTDLKDDLQNMDLHRYIGQIPADRIFLAYDEADQLVRYTDIQSFLREYPAIHSFKINGGGHFRIMKNPEVIGEVAGFLQK